MSRLVPEFELDDDTPVMAPHTDYFTQITKVIDEAPLEAVIDYLVFRSGIHLVNRSFYQCSSGVELYTVPTIINRIQENPGLCSRDDRYHENPAELVRQNFHWNGYSPSKVLNDFALFIRK